MQPDQQQSLISYLSGFVNEERQQLLKRILADRTRYITVVLEDIYYPQNASAVLRTCECLGIQELHIIENKNSYQLNPDVVRGASKWIELVRYKGERQTGSCIEMLKKQDYRIAAMMPDDRSIDLEDLPVDRKLALCFGTEETGLSREFIDNADYRVRIPMHGFTQSYNLSVSAGITLYSVTGRLRNSGCDWMLDANDRASLYIDWLVKSTPNGEILMKRFLEEQSDTGS